MKISSFIFLIFLFSGRIYYAQVPTFSKTFKDTLRLSCLSSRPVEIDSGIYLVASAGGGLSLLEGGYQRIYSVNDLGEKQIDRLHYDTTRRFFGFSRLKKSIDGNLLLASTRSLDGGTGGNRMFILKLSPDLSDTIWSYYNHDSLYFDTTKDLFEAPDGDIVVIINRDFFGADSTTGVFIRLNSEGSYQAEAVMRERMVQHPENVVLMNNGNFLIGGDRGTISNAGL